MEVAQIITEKIRFRVVCALHCHDKNTTHICLNVALLTLVILFQPITMNEASKKNQKLHKIIIKVVHMNMIEVVIH